MRQYPHFYHSKGNTCSCLPTKPLVHAILPVGSTTDPRQAANPSARRPLGWPYSTVPTPLHPPVEPKPNKERGCNEHFAKQKAKTFSRGHQADQCHHYSTAKTTYHSHSTKLVTPLTAPAPCAGNQRCYKENMGSSTHSHSRCLILTTLKMAPAKIGFQLI